MKTAVEFDQFADAYDSAINQALSVSGENKDYFARGRVSFLARCLRELGLRELGESPRSALDYGCGIGGTAQLLRDLAGVGCVVGLDISERSLERARGLYGDDAIRFQTFEQYKPAAEIDLAYCNGVFHHIPIEERRAAAEYVHGALRPGGVFAFWENNPWNPGTRYVMAKCVFDRHAVTMTSTDAKRMLVEAGFEILRTDFLFYFPRVLQAFRFMEPGLKRLPLGAQYQVLCRRRPA
jgi:SAM-dependent methyltransferase